MPPEPLPWDRNKDRKHERGTIVDALAGGATSSSGGPRWRDNFYSRASPRRPSLAYHKQGSSYQQIYPDESYGPRSGDRFWAGDDRRYGSRSRSVSREGRGSFRLSPYLAPSNIYRQHHNEAPPLPPSPQPPVTGLRSVAVPITSPITLKGHHENKRGDDESATDHSLGSSANMPRRWSRPGSLSRSNSEDASTPSRKEIPLQSPPASSADEGMPRKKPRLGWGEGLAKYEKKMVEGSDEGSGKSGLEQKTSLSLPGSASPLTPCSVVRSSSPGVAEKPSLKIADDIMDIDQNLDLLCFSSECSYEHRLNLLLFDLLQKEDNCSGDIGHNALSKLLTLKSDISRELEKTENDIDQLEIKLKTFNSHESKYLSQMSCLQDESDTDHFVELAGDHMNVTIDDRVLESSAAALPVALIADTREEHDDTEPAHMGSTDTVSSKIGKEVSLSKELSHSDNQRGALSPASTTKVVINETATVSADGENHANSISDANMEDDRGALHVDAVAKLIMSSNQDAATKASHVFNRFMPSCSTKYDICEPIKFLSLRANVVPVGEVLAKLKRSTKLKESVAAFRYRLAYLMRKEDLDLRKQRTKSQKRQDVSCRFQLPSIQKQRSSPRSRFLSSCISMLQPTTGTLNFFSKLMQDFHVKIQRECLRMPACVLLKERRYSLITSNNGLVEDPISFEMERLMINPWSQEEKELFMGMLPNFGKDFSKIASFLPHKTTADCIEFYYKNHKMKSFKKVKKLFKKQPEYLTTDNYPRTAGKKWKHETNYGSLSMLRDSAAYSRNSLSCGYPDLIVSKRSHVFAEKSNPVEVSRYESETVAANILAGISSIRSSGAVGSGITSSIHPSNKLNFTRADRPVAPEIAQNLGEEDDSSDEACGELEAVDWTDDEKSLFIRALGMYGKDFSCISSCIKKRSREQCKIFFSKARKCLGLDTIHQGSGGGTLLSDTNGGSSDTEDACGVDMDSGICSTQSCSQVDADFTQSMAITGEFSIKAEKSCEQVEAERSSNHCDPAGSVEGEVEMKVGKAVLGTGKVSQSCTSLKNVDDGVLKCNESVQLLQASDPCSDINVKAEKGNPPSFPAQRFSICLGAHEFKPLNTFIAKQDDSVQFCPTWLKEEPESGQCPISEDKMQDRSHQLEIDAHSSADTNHPGELLDVCSSPISSDCYKDQIHPDAHMSKEPVPAVQVPSASVPIVSMLANQSSVSHGSSFCTVSGSAIKFDDCEHSLSSKACFDQVGVPSILSGYPFPLLDKKKKNVEPSSGPIFLESNTEIDRTTEVKSFSILDSLNGFCNISNFPCTRSEIICSSRNEGLLDTQLRSRSQSDCAESKEPEILTGDVKLFGKILNNPSSMHKKSNSFSDECCSKLPFPKPSPSTPPKLPDMLKEAGDLVAGGCGSVIHLGMEEVPTRTYGFWDGNRIQTGYSKLPESAILLANCHGSVGGVSVFSSNESFQSNEGVLSGYQQPFIQGLQKRNGFERISGIQQQSRGGCLGINLMGCGGVMANGGGGACNGVSDPVAAFKVHYARAKFRGEKDSRRRDVGRR